MMMKISKYFAYTLLACSFFSCDKEELPEVKTPEDKTLFMEATGSLEPFDLVDYDLAAKGDDELRAHLTSKGYGKGPHLTYKTTDFGVRMKGKTLVNPAVVEPRWGVIGFGEWTIANNAVQGIETDPTNRPSGLDMSTVVVEQKNGHSVIHQYWWKKSGNYASFRPGSYGFMSVSGVSGYGSMYCWYRQYFNNSIRDEVFRENGNLANRTTAELGIDPNEKLVAVKDGQIDADRHIPMMTDLVQVYSTDEAVNGAQTPSNDGTKMAAQMNWNFKPRGSLFAIRLKNVIGEDIIVKSIKVQNESPLWFAGYYDWGWARDRQDPYFTNPNNRKVLPIRFVGQRLTNGTANHPKFTGPYNTYPLCQNDPNNTQGVEIPANAIDADLPLFYLWGHQMDNKIGEPLKFKIVYSTKARPSADKESLLMSIAPPKTKREVTIVENVEYYVPNNISKLLIKPGTTPVVRTVKRGGFHSGVAYSVTVKVQKQKSDWETPAEYDYPDLGGYTY